jgi:hypothetical protein
MVYDWERQCVVTFSFLACVFSRSVDGEGAPGYAGDAARLRANRWTVR